MSTQPNIVLILTDQYRGDALSATGHPIARTPNLDHLATKGVVFTSAYSPCPSCIAARASLFTGLHPTNTGRLGYRDRVPWNYDAMLPEVLRATGYQTHCVGKTHFYPQRKHCGFQSLDSYEASQNLDGDYVNDYHDWVHEKTGGTVGEFDHGLTSNSWNARPSPLPEALHNNSWVVTKGLEFLRRRDKTRPFFLNLSFHRPHPPIDPPQVMWDMYQGMELPPVPVGQWAKHHDKPVADLNAWEGRLAPWLLDQARRGYYAQIAHIDSQIGRLLRYLERNSQGPTVFLFTSDHGEMLGDHHLFRKSYAYEGSAKVPLIISHPDRGAGTTSDTPVVLEDLYTTILDAAGASLPSRVDGESLMPEVLGAGRLDREYVHGEHSACYSPDEAMQFVTDGREKYIWYTKTGAEQFFDLQNDPQELHDLAGEPQEESRLERWRGRLVERLRVRQDDGLTDGRRLTPGTLLPPVRPSAVADAP